MQVSAKPNFGYPFYHCSWYGAGIKSFVTAPSHAVCPAVYQGSCNIGLRVPLPVRSATCCLSLLIVRLLVGFVCCFSLCLSFSPYFALSFWPRLPAISFLHTHTHNLSLSLSVSPPPFPACPPCSPHTLAALILGVPFPNGCKPI